MGIRVKRLLIRRGRPIHLPNLAGKRIALDTTLYMTKLFKCSDTWLIDFECMLRNFKELHIHLCCVFDGRRPPDEKRLCADHRRTRNDEGLKRMEQNWPQHPFRSRRFRLPSREEKRLVYALVLKYGFELCFADSEGEALCCGLLEQGMVDYVLTEDSDVIAYAPEHFLHYFRIWHFIRRDYRLGGCEYFHTASILRERRMSAQDLLRVIAITGCDYTTPLFEWNRWLNDEHVLRYVLRTAQKYDYAANLAIVERMFKPSYIKHELDVVT
jgi:5'-3' exonuclease